MPDLSAAQRAPLLGLALAGLVVGVAAGLARLGYRVPSFALPAAAWHGPLMLGGFSASSSRSRSVSIGRRWAYAGPLLGGLGGVALAAGAAAWAAWLLFAGSAVLMAASGATFRRQRRLCTLTLLLGAACWAVGNLRFALGADVGDVVPGWLAFLVLTVAGERLELTHAVPPSPIATRLYGVILVLIAAGLATALPHFIVAFSAGLLALSAWLFVHDIVSEARRGAESRFAAACLMSAYVWLAIGATTALAGGLAPASRSYDAAIHAIALGFAFSTAFGHAPRVIAVVLKVNVPPHATFYIPLLLLHGSLALRYCGDVADRMAWIRVGGMLNVFALAAFAIAIVSAILREQADAAMRSRDA